MSDVTLKIDADTAAYIAKIAKMAEAHEGVNSKLKDHSKFADHLTHGLERAVFRAIALKEMAQAIAQAFSEASAKAAQINKKESDFRESIATSLTSIGFGGQGLDAAMSVVEQQGGMATEAQRQSFVQRMESEQQRRRKANMPLISPKQFYETFNAYRQGGDIAFGRGGEDLLNVYSDPRYGYGVGRDMNAFANETAARRFNLPKGTRGALQIGMSYVDDVMPNEERVRAGIMENERQARDAARYTGQAARLAEPFKERMAVERPFFSALKNVANAGSLGATDAIYQKSVEHQERANKLNERRILREDAHDEGKK